MLCPGAGRGLGHPTAPQHPPGAWGGTSLCLHPSIHLVLGGTRGASASIPPSICPSIPPSPCPYFPLGTGVFPTPPCYGAVPPQPGTARALCQHFSPPHHPSGCSEVYVPPPRPWHSQAMPSSGGSGGVRAGDVGGGCCLVPTCTPRSRLQFWGALTPSAPIPASHWTQDPLQPLFGPPRAAGAAPAA